MKSENNQDQKKCTLRVGGTQVRMKNRTRADHKLLSNVMMEL